MKNFLTKNLPIKILSLILAGLFWFFVLSSEDTFKVVETPFEVQAFNVPEGLSVLNDLGTVQLTVLADQEIYKNINPENFTIYVDLTGLSDGTHSVPITANSNLPEVNIIHVEPSNISVNLESLDTSTLPLSVEVIGSPNPNYSVDATNATETSITLRGAQSAIEQVYQVVAPFELNGIETSNTTQTVTLQAQDLNGQPIPGIILEPATTQVTATISANQAQKTLSIKVNLDSPDGYWVSAISTDPVVLFVQGDPDTLESFNFIETETLVIPGGQANYQTQTQIQLPAGLEWVDPNDQWVTVTVVLESSSGV